MVRVVLLRVALLALMTAPAACLEDRGDGEGAGYVVGSAADVTDTVRVAWQYQDTDTAAVRATFRGEVPIAGGVFDIEALLQSVGSFDPPVRTCLDTLARQIDTAATGGEVVDFAVGGIVATQGPLPADDLDGPQMAEAVRAAALDVAVVWSARDVPRDSVTGQRLESSLRAGLQLARLRQCRVPVDCQGVEDLTVMLTGDPDPDLCLDPWPDRGLILLQPTSFGR